MTIKSSSFSVPWGMIVKLVVSGSLISWLLQKIDIVEVWGIIQNLHGGLISIVLLVIWLTLFAIALRWQQIVRLGGLQAPLPSLIEATFIGAFFNQILPSSVGGDFYRILAVRRYKATLNNAVTSVFLDRLFGFISLGIMCLLAIPAEGKILLDSELKWPFLVTMTLLSGVFLGGFILLFVPKHWHSFFWVRPFHTVIEVVQQSLHQKSLFLSMFLSSLIASFFLILGLQILMVAFDIPLTWGQGAAILPAVMLLSSLPISFAGWGLREGAIIIALGVYNVSQETALALSLVYGVLQLISAIPGLILWVWEKRRLKPLEVSL